MEGLSPNPEDDMGLEGTGDSREETSSATQESDKTFEKLSEEGIAAIQGSMSGEEEDETSEEAALDESDEKVVVPEEDVETGDDL